MLALSSLFQCVGVRVFLFEWGQIDRQFHSSMKNLQCAHRGISVQWVLLVFCRHVAPNQMIWTSFACYTFKNRLLCRLETVEGMRNSWPGYFDRLILLDLQE